MRRTALRLLNLIGAIGLIGLSGVMSGTPAVAQPYEPVKAVHSEQVQAGPYRLTVGFSAWPLKAMQSLDFTFVPGGGIGGKSGTITLIGPDGARQESRLVRHPRNRQVWGLDILALPDQGRWTLRFAVNGPSGSGTGDVVVNVLEQPGPPLGISWAISSVPVLGLITLIVTAWRRTWPSAARREEKVPYNQLS